MGKSGGGLCDVAYQIPDYCPPAPVCPVCPPAWPAWPAWPVCIHNSPDAFSPGYGLHTTTSLRVLCWARGRVNRSDSIIFFADDHNRCLPPCMADTVSSALVPCLVVW